MERGARGERGRHGRRRRTRWSSSNIFGVVYCLARYCSRCSRHSTESPVCTINYSLRPKMNKSNSRPAVFYRLPRTGVGRWRPLQNGRAACARPAPAPSARKAPGARQPASDNVKGDAVRVSHVTTCVSYQVSHPYAARYRCIILFNDNVERAESVRPPRHVVVEMCDRIGGAQRPLPVPNRNPAGTAFAALRIASRVPVLRPARGTRAAAARRQVCWKSQKSSP